MEQRLKAIQRQPQNEIHPIIRHQTLTVLLMPRSTPRQEPSIAVL
ncbi:rCG62620 [Rattus norvegicus]|uniref:RCG62620 n=1 Tax=Rattus norvegicus TaxID=10116 RepID=A6J5Q8_RAT|nr:rCG62620 [Rattus norvegicus]